MTFNRLFLFLLLARSSLAAHRRHMKQNLVVLLADLFNVFEIHPAPCVDYPESEQASGESNDNEINFYYQIQLKLIQNK